MKTRETISLMDEARIERTLKRIAHQVLEANSGDRDLLLMGINERGYAVAAELAAYLRPETKLKVDCRRLPVSTEGEGEGEREEEPLTFASGEVFPVLADDVIFSGATMFKALKRITAAADFGEVHTVALVDRGHRKFPVMAEFVGLELPTKFDEHVSVRTGKERVLGVDLFKES